MEINRLNDLNDLIEKYTCDLSEWEFIGSITEEDINEWQKYSQYIRHYCEDEAFLNEVDKLQEEIANLPKRWQTNENAIKEYQDNPDFYKQTVVETMVLVNDRRETSLSQSYQHIKQLLVGHGTAYDEARRDYIDSINKLIGGYEGENKLIEGLKTGLATSEQRILGNININNNEHDLIIVSKKGIFTIEIKNHYTHMLWTAKGTFKEGRKNNKTGEIEYTQIDPLKDPYNQALLHRNSLYEALKPIGDFEVQYYVVLCNWLKEPTAADNTILKRIKLLNAFIEEYSHYPDILTNEQVDTICQFIEKNSTGDKKFPFPDIAKINQITADFITSHDLRFQDIAVPKYMAICRAIVEDYAAKKIRLFNKIKNFKLGHDKDDNSLPSFSITDSLGEKFRFFSWPLIVFVIEGLVIGYYYDKYILSLGIFLLIWALIVLFVNNGRKYFREIAGYETRESYRTEYTSVQRIAVLRVLGLLTKKQKEEEAEAKDVIEHFIHKYSHIHDSYIKFNDLVKNVPEL